MVETVLFLHNVEKWYKVNMHFWFCFGLLAFNTLILNAGEAKTSENVWENSRIEISETEIKVTPNFSVIPEVDYNLIFECISAWCKGQETQKIPLSYTYISEQNYTIFKRGNILLPYTEYIPKIRLDTTLQQEYATIRTNPGRPGRVRNLSVYCKTDREIGLKWQPPYPPTGIISTYFVTLNGKTKKEVYPCHIWKGYSCLNITHLKANTKYTMKVRALNQDVQDLGQAFSISDSTSEKGSNFLDDTEVEYSPQNSAIRFIWGNSTDFYCKPSRVKIYVGTQVRYNVGIEDVSNIEIPLAASTHASNISVVVQNFAGEEYTAHAKIFKGAELKNKIMKNSFITYLCSENCKFKISKGLIPCENAVLLLLKNWEQNISLEDISQDYFQFKKTKKINNIAEVNLDGRYATAEIFETDFNSVSVIGNNTPIYSLTPEDGLLCFNKAVELSSKTSSKPPPNVARKITVSTRKLQNETMSTSSTNEKTQTNVLLRPKILITIFVALIILLVVSIMLRRYIRRKNRRTSASEHLPKKIVEEDELELNYYYPNLVDSENDLINLHNRNETDYPDEGANLFNQSFRIQNLVESDMSEESTADPRNYYTDILDRSSFSETPNDSESTYYDKFVPELSNIINTKYFENYLLELCDNNMIPLRTEFERTEKICRMFYKDDSTTINHFAKRNSEMKTRKDTHPVYIKGYIEPRAFIHIRYPKPPQINDFWGMIWSRCIKNVVAVENSSSKEQEIHKNWPHHEDMFGEIVVINGGMMNIMGHTITKFILKYGRKTRVVVLYKVIFGSNGCIEDLLGCMKIFPSISETRPTVIICEEESLLGTLLLCSIAMKVAQCERKVDFMAILFSLGVQKLSFLSSINDYILAHFVVYDCLHDKKFSIPIDSKFETRIETILKRKSVKPLMEAVENNLYLYQKMFKFQNFQMSCFPYTNAVEVDCFASSRKFICTPQPGIKEMRGFWQLVAETEINTIISLNQLDRSKPTHFVFWDNNINLTDSPVKLKVIEERDWGHFTSIRVNTICDRHFKEITLVNVKDWKRGTFRPPTIQNLLTIWHKTYEGTWTNKDKGAILLTCSNGYTACGLFMAMSILLETIDLEKTCEVYAAVKLVRRFNQQFVQEWGQFDFLHKIALEYCKNFVRPNHSE